MKKLKILYLINSLKIEKILFTKIILVNYETKKRTLF